MLKASTELRSPYGPALLGVHLLGWFTLAATLLLICSGGLVTSKGVGMAVPDWPTSYGYNMFLFPVSRWVGGVFYEHTHRLLATGVGFLTMILAVSLLVVEKRPWMKYLGVAAFFAVVVQGLLGGLRVTLFKNEIGIFHGILAQLFLCCVACIVLFTSKSFVSGNFFKGSAPGTMRWAALALVLGMFVQLAIGAAMRHSHTGLSIPDFPLAYGQIWPSTDGDAMEKINAERRAQNQPETTPLLISLQMKHRVLAFLLLAGVTWFAFLARTLPDRRLKNLSTIWFYLVLAQVMLGAWTIWSNKAADVATAHVFLGAVCLLTGVMIVMRQFFSLQNPQPATIREKVYTVLACKFDKRGKKRSGAAL